MSLPDAFVCVIEARIHVEDSDSLKSKRKVVRLCFAAQGMFSWTRPWVRQMISRGL